MAANSYRKEIPVENLDKLASTASGSTVTGAREVEHDMPERKEDMAGTREENRWSELNRCKLWLGQQQVDYNTELVKCRLQQSEELQPSAGDDVDVDVSDLCERITKLQGQLFVAASTKSYGKVVLERLLQGDMLMKILFPDILTEHPSQEDIDKMNEFAKVCVKNNDICSKMLENHKEITVKQQELDIKKRENYEIMKTNRELMAKLQNLRQSRTNETTRSTSDHDALVKAKERQCHSLSKLNVIANIFQGLIAGSSINWAADEDMRKLVINLGEIMQNR